MSPSVGENRNCRSFERAGRSGYTTLTRSIDWSKGIIRKSAREGDEDAGLNRK